MRPAHPAVEGAAAYAVTYAMRPPRLDLALEDERRNLDRREAFEEQGLRDSDDNVFAPTRMELKLAA